MPSSFADRLWWARHKAGLGATRLARLVGCSQSLISGLERNNAERSKLNNKFAHALKVDPTWLAHGVVDRAPADFDEAMAKKGREGMATEPASIVRLPTSPAASQQPRWNEGSPGEPLAPLAGADAMMKELMNLFMDFARLAGPERALKLLETFKHVAALVSFEQGGEGHQHVMGASDQRNEGTNH